MQGNQVLNFIKDVIANMPSAWLDLTTHRLDIYDEKLAKTQFLEAFENLYNQNNSSTKALSDLPTAYDYIRLGHPLSCVLEWVIADANKLKPQNVISFASKTTPILAILRKNLLSNTKTLITYSGELPRCFDVDLVRNVYNYSFELKRVDRMEDAPLFDGSVVYVSEVEEPNSVRLNDNIDFYIGLYSNQGSIALIGNNQDPSYVLEIQHVRRRETIAMTPADCLTALKSIVGISIGDTDIPMKQESKQKVLTSLKEITDTSAQPLVASSGLSIQYAIMMGLVHDALDNHPGKDIKFIVPPNCYGGTNDQARRVAACIDNVSVVDLPVDGDNDMVQSIDTVLAEIAMQNAIPYIIAEIPTNPRVEVPDLMQLKSVLSKPRKTANGEPAIDPVFILDQTFCPNVHFMSDNPNTVGLTTVRALSYASGSKFPSGGKCTAGYCVANTLAEPLMAKIGIHLTLCNNEATDLQMDILATQLPSMNQRIQDAYVNTREFANYIGGVLPNAKINFVSEELAEQGFTPSVFSLDLPTKGDTAEEMESYKRALNLKLINLMIGKIPDESKYCVSYGQLKGCYWTIPATSTQGTTKEGDKDYIARVALSANMDLDLHKKVFKQFVDSI